MSHIPPDECSSVWSVRFNAIQERFQHVIRLNAFSHKHIDSFLMTYSVSNPFRPINVITIAPSVTTFSGLNPAF